MTVFDSSDTPILDVARNGGHRLNFECLSGWLTAHQRSWGMITTGIVERSTNCRLVLPSMSPA